MTLDYDKNEFYRAHLARDARFDGKFFVAVKSTKIYCRPVCPARKAKLENLTFYLYAAQAEDAGYRPCLRCRPETAPGSAAWLGTSTTVRRAIRLMDTLASENLSINELANKLGIGQRWLRELFRQQVGVSPKKLLLEKKLTLARNLVDNSGLSITDVAFSAGFNSVRRFNTAFKHRFHVTPSSCKHQKSNTQIISIFLRYRPPFAWSRILSYLQYREINTMELVDNNSYQRLFFYQAQPGWLRVSIADDNKLKIEFKLAKLTHILDLIARIKDMFDLDADPLRIALDLQRDKKLKPLVKTQPGLRIPGCWDGFELAVRAIIGQLISVQAARTILNRLVVLCGDKQTFDVNLKLTHFFPCPQALLQADLKTIGLTKSKENALRQLAQAVLDKIIVLDGTADYEQTCRALLAIKGIGPWTVQYIALRALKNPDAFPENDLELRKRIKQYNLEPKLWTPWRAYAAILLFNLAS